jgi:hypothetical protein
MAGIRTPDTVVYLTEKLISECLNKFRAAGVHYAVAGTCC